MKVRIPPEAEAAAAVAAVALPVLAVAAFPVALPVQELRVAQGVLMRVLVATEEVTAQVVLLARLAIIMQVEQVAVLVQQEAQVLQEVPAQRAAQEPLAQQALLERKAIVLRATAT